MRTALTGLWERGPRTNLPMRLRLAATSLDYRQPKTRPSFGAKKPVRSAIKSLSFPLARFCGAGHFRLQPIKPLVF